MAYEGWLEFNGVEVVNLGRTVALSRALGINAVRVKDASVGWIEMTMDDPGFGLSAFGVDPFGYGYGSAVDYRNIEEAPWYDANHPASREFAGFLPLDVRGLEGSTQAAEVTEYITNGGYSGAGRHATLSIVASMVVVARTERGAEFGLKWLNRVLAPDSTGVLAVGHDLTYFRYAETHAPKAHRRNVRLTRGTSITMKRDASCYSLWKITFTLTAGDPFEYGVPEERVEGLGGSNPTGEGLIGHGVEDLVEEGCPAFDYSPVFDPAHPALIPSPTAPNFLPDGWDIEIGMGFRRRWARVPGLVPASLNAVPHFALTTESDARRVRLSIWDGREHPTTQCGPLWSVVVNYLPAGQTFYVDGERETAYIWDGQTPFVRRADTVLFSPLGGPVEWPSVSAPDLLVTLDTFSTGASTFEGGGSIRASMSLIPKSD